MDLLEELKKNGPSCIFMTCHLEKITDAFEYKIIAALNGRQFELFKTRNPITAIKELEACCLKYSISESDNSSIKSIDNSISTLEDYVKRITADREARESELNKLTKKELMQKAKDMKLEFRTAMSKEEIVSIIMKY